MVLTLKRRNLAFVAMATLLAASAFRAQDTARQSQLPQWQVAAGGKMAFEVASVKRSAPQADYRSNFPLTLGSSFGSVGNLMSVNVPLRALIGFAFKLSGGQTQFLISGLPKWVDSEWFDVEARAPIAAPSKDQFRLMVQSLFASRFKLALRQEKRQIPMYALVLTKSGRTGQQLKPHIDDAQCGAEGRPDAPSAPPEFAAFPCGATLMGRAPLVGRSGTAGWLRGGGRDVNLDYIAAFFTGSGVLGSGSDRPVVNQTGLTGNYDFWIEFVPEGTPDAIRSNANGPSFPEALRDQLGLKLVAQKGPVDVLVVDHIEKPSPN